jgi:uncharacterized protein (TIGR03437 family)
MKKRMAMLVPLIALTAMGAQGQGLVHCVLASETADVILNGLAEPAGDIFLRCGGAAPGAALRGGFQLSVSAALGNRRVDGRLPEVTMAVETAGGFVPAPYLPRGSGNTIFFESIDLNFDAAGRLGLRFRGIRVQAQGLVQAWLHFGGSPQLLVSSPVTAIARPLQGLLHGFTAAPAVAAAELPPAIDYDVLVGAQAALLTTRVSEVNPAVFSARRGAADTGLRVIVRYQEAPGDAVVYVPHAVAGSSALEFTSGGDMGVTPARGRWVRDSGTLLLARVAGADSSGRGGAFSFTPSPGENALGGYGPADAERGNPYAVYEVLDANPSVIEFVHIPAFVWRPPECRGPAPMIHHTVSLAPVSAAAGITETEPVPRYPGVALGPDCELMGDCGAAHFPGMMVRPLQEMSFVLNSGGTFHAAMVQIVNPNQGFLEWRALVRYRRGADWIRVETPTGVNNANIRFDIDPRALPEGEYAAEIVIVQLRSPTGRAVEVAIPVALRVLPPVPAQPEIPRPVVTDVFNAADRTIGPVAPGSLAAITGANFLEASVVTIGGLEAVRVSARPNEIVAVVPAIGGLAGRAAVVVRNADRPSVAWGVEIAPVAPAVFHVLNEDGSRNGEGHPAAAGSPVKIFLTGVAHAAIPLALRIHDRVFDDVSFEPAAPGVEQLTIVVPEDLPAMQTAFMVCANAREAPYQSCAEPHRIWLRRP